MPDLAAALDNDILIKCACYRLLASVADEFQGEERVGVLGTARFVVTDQLARRADVTIGEAARESWRSFLTGVHELEPSEREVEIATSLEEEATKLGVRLDFGESQLCAIALVRGIPWVVTGDKRAIQALEQLLDSIDDLQPICGRVVCLEQLIANLGGRLDTSELRSLICSAPAVDVALTNCFECSRGKHHEVSGAEGLHSYIRDLRRSAPRTLSGTDDPQS